MNVTDKHTIIQACKEKGANDCKIIDPRTIVVGHWTRHKCQYGCSAYNTNLCCPPYSPKADETKKLVSDYSTALLVNFKPGSKVSKAMVQIEREVFLMNYHKAICFAAGPCTICKECDLLKCKAPKLARPSMEACGIDVYATARSNGFFIQVLTSKDEIANYYGLLLIE